VRKNIFINVATIGRYDKVLIELCKRVVDSGLYDASESVFLVLNGDKSLFDASLSAQYIKDRSKFQVDHASTSVESCEFPTLQRIWDFCQSEDSLVLYLHTKGVTRPETQSISDWVDYLTYFNIDKWTDRVSELQQSSCTGVNLSGNPADLDTHPSTWGYGKAPMHYSGNFWWSKSEHITRLTSPDLWLPDKNYLRWRVMAEMWVCHYANGVYYCPWRSGVDHYVSRYPRSYYE
jgi:hypothetical protein